MEINKTKNGWIQVKWREVKWDERSLTNYNGPPHCSRVQVKIPCDPTPKGHLFYCEENKRSPCNQPTLLNEFFVLSALSGEDWLVHPSWPSLHSKESAICRFIDFCTPPPLPPPPKRGLKIEALLSYKGGGRGSNYFNSWNQKKIVVLQTWNIIIQWILPSKFK